MASLEAPVDDVAFAARGEDFGDLSAQGGIAARAPIGAQVEDRQFAFEQPRNARADRMAVIEDDTTMACAQTRDFRAQL